MPAPTRPSSPLKIAAPPEGPLLLPLELLEDPLDVAFEIVGRKWTIHLLREAMRQGGTIRFNELLKRVSGLNPKSLAARLKELEHGGLLERKVVPGTPIHTEYTLTQKGWALKPVLMCMAWYSLRWRPEAVLNQERPPSDTKLWRTVSMYCGPGGDDCGWPWAGPFVSQGSKARGEGNRSPP